MTFPLWLQHLIETYGYWVVFVAVALETMGIPFPGETALVVGAVYAGTGHNLNIALVIAFASVGAITGDNIGFNVGRYGGFPLVRRILQTRVARFFHLSESTLSFAQYFFRRHGDKTVFVGRFFSLLRVWVAFLAGVNRMPWRSFLFWNALGGIAWATVYGMLGYALGRNLDLLGRVLRILGTSGVVICCVAVAGLIAWRFVRRQRTRRNQADILPELAAPAPAEQEVTTITGS